MANIAIFRINYKSDFILTLNSDAGWMTPFCIKFWTSAPSQAYFVGFDGTTYTHCAPVAGEPTKLLVQFDDHHLPIGDLKFQIGYHFTVADFPTSVEDEVINQASVIIEVDDAPAQVMLDLNGETAPEIEFSLPAYANEAQRIANEQQRIANEQTRIQNEEARIAAEATRQQNESQRIRQEEARVSEFAQLKLQSQDATSAANTAAALANEKAALAADKAALAGAAATLANAKAQLAADKAALAASAAQLANDKAALAQQKAEYAQQQGDYAKAQGDTALADHRRAESDHTTAADDHTRAESDHGIAADDHTQAGNDHTRAESDHSTAASDHTRAGNDHTTAQSDHGIAADDHTQAGNDHTRAESDHGIAADDHTQAGNDHTRAESDHTRAEQDHTDVQNAIEAADLVYDISKANAVGGVLATYADLSAALGVDGANVPVNRRQGGMTVKFVLTSDNKYVQYRLMSDSFSTSESDWQGVDDEPTAGSKNLVESGGAFEETHVWKNIELSTEPTNTINPSNVWVAKTNTSYGIIMPIVAGNSYKLSTTGNSTRFALLKTNDTSSGGVPSFCDNYVGRMLCEDGIPFVFEAPVDANYLYILKRSSAGILNVSLDIAMSVKENLENIQENYLGYIEQTPSSAQQKQARENLGLGDGDIDDVPTPKSDNMVKSGGVYSSIFDSTTGYSQIDISQAPETKVIDKNNNWADIASNSAGIIVPVVAGKTYKLIPETYVTYAFLQSNDTSIAPQFCNGYSGRMSTYSTLVFTAPIDCNYLFMFKKVLAGTLIYSLYESVNVIDYKDEAPVYGSNRFVESGGTFLQFYKLQQESNVFLPGVIKHLVPSICVNSGYIDNNGIVKGLQSTHGYSDPIAVSAGDKISITGVGNGIPYFVYCLQDGTFVSSSPNSTGLDSTYKITFNEDKYIRINGRIKDNGLGLVGGLIYNGQDLNTINDAVNYNIYKYVVTRGAVYNKISNGVEITLNTLFVYNVFSNSGRTINDSTKYTLNSASRFLVLKEDNTLGTRINSAAILSTDLVLLYYDDNSLNKDIIGGELYADYLSKIKIDNDSPINDVPSNLGQVNCVRKAYQMASLKWTPKNGNIPYNSGNFTANEEQTGMIYSSVREYDKFAFVDISLETFMTAVNNPRSVLYTENVSAANSRSAIGRTYYGTNCAAYYGSVCSGLLIFAYGLPVNVTTYEFRNWDKMEEIEDQTPYGLQIGDAIWQSGHIQLCTGITRNRYGIITNIEVIENAASTTRIKNYSAASLQNYINNNNCVLLRYKELYKNRNYVPLTNFVAVEDETLGSYIYNNDICPNYGNKSCYNEGDSVVINLRSDYASAGFTTIEVYKDDTLIISRTISGEDEVLTGLVYGDYKARIVGNDNSEYCQFKVVNASVVKDGDSFTFDSENATPIYYEFCNLQGSRNHDIVGLSTHVFTNAELTVGEATPTSPVISTDDYHYLKVHFQTEYGRVIKVIDWNV